MMSRFGIDVGNSKTKLLQLPKASPPSEGGALVDWIAGCSLTEIEFEDVLSLVPSGTQVELVSVDPARGQSLAQELAGQGVVVRTWTSAKLPIKNIYVDDSTLGPDRPLAAYAAFAEAQRACIVVDAGTALTVDLVDNHGVFMGGAIAPGLRTIAKSLGQAGAMLHDTPARDVEYPGESTTDCLAIGSYATFVGSVTELVRRARACIPTAKIVVTGGDAKIVMDILKEESPDCRPLIHLALALLSWQEEVECD